MSVNLQITIDSLEPHRLAAFYERADIGYIAEDQTGAIEQLLDQGLVTPDQVVQVAERRGFADTAACSDPNGRLPRLHFQRVDEPKTAKNRLHLDIQFQGDSEARDVLIDRLVDLGATRKGTGSQGPSHAWTILADPEDNEFCVSN